MPRVSVPDLSVCLEGVLKPLPRPRRLPLIEGQEARCPRCDRIMVVRMGRRMPEYYCACDGNGKKPRST